jgi:hypothetical protein
LLLMLQASLLLLPSSSSGVPDRQVIAVVTLEPGGVTWPTTRPASLSARAQTAPPPAGLGNTSTETRPLPCAGRAHSTPSAKVLQAQMPVAPPLRTRRSKCTIAAPEETAG